MERSKQRIGFVIRPPEIVRYPGRLGVWMGPAVQSSLALTGWVMNGNRTGIVRSWFQWRTVINSGNYLSENHSLHLGEPKKQTLRQEYLNSQSCVELGRVIVTRIISLAIWYMNNELNNIWTYSNKSRNENCNEMELNKMKKSPFHFLRPIWHWTEKQWWHPDGYLNICHWSITRESYLCAKRP